MKFVWDIRSKKYINDMPKKFKEGVAQGILWSVLFAEGRAKSIFKEGGPVLPPPGPLVSRTGNLRESIRSGAKGNMGWIGTDVFYGRIHELGLGKPKRPFLMPSFTGNNLERIREEITKKIIGEMTK